MRAVFLIALFLTSLVAASPSQAQCGSCPERCSAKNIWGCIRRSVDPLCIKNKVRCEAREAARRQGGGVGQFAANADEEAERLEREAQANAEAIARLRLEEIRTCLENLADCPSRVANRISGDDVRLINACRNNLRNCPGHVIERLPAFVLKEIVGTYKDGLVGQAYARWKTLPQWFINEFKDDYPNVDLGQIQYATDIKTGHGQAITFYYQIFFPEAIDLRKRSDMEWMLHELQHTRQYVLKGGEDAFLSEYFLHVPGEAMARRVIDVHDYVSIEQDANAKATELIDRYGWNIFVENNCHLPVKTWFHYLDAAGNWVTYPRGWLWNPGKGGAMTRSDGRLMHTANQLFYFHAEVVGKIRGIQYSWDGDLEREIQDYDFSREDPNKLYSRVAKFKEHDNTEEAPEWLPLSLSCDNIPKRE